MFSCDFNENGRQHKRDNMMKDESFKMKSGLIVTICDNAESKVRKKNNYFQIFCILAFPSKKSCNFAVVLVQFIIREYKFR